MPKLKSKSSVKKRFSLTASGKIRRTKAGKRHGMTKRSARSLRDQTGTALVFKGDEALIRPFLPYGSR